MKVFSFILIYTCNFLFSFEPAPPVQQGGVMTKEHQINFCEHVNNDKLRRKFYRKKDFLNFKNFTYQRKGRCRGHAIVSQILGELLLFSPHKKYDECLDSEDQNCQLDIMKEQVKKAYYDLEVQEIRGIKNLKELSSHSNIRATLKAIISSIPHRFHTRVHRPQDENTTLARHSFNVAMMRIFNHHHYPYIGIQGKGVGDHALIGIGVTYDFQRMGLVLCVRDSNILKDKDNCNEYIYLEDERPYYFKKGKSFYLSKFYLYTEDDERMERLKRAIEGYCHEHFVDSKKNALSLN